MVLYAAYPRLRQKNDNQLRLAGTVWLLPIQSLVDGVIHLNLF
jgi:hypothetical protein